MIANQDIENEDLIVTQLRLEEAMTSRGMDRYFRDTERAKEGSREEQTSYGRTIMAGKLRFLAEAIEAWQKETEEGAATKNGAAYIRIGKRCPRELAYLTMKQVLSGLSYTRSIQDVAVNIGEAIEDEQRLAEVRKAERGTYESILRGVKTRRSQYHKHYYVTRAASHHDAWEGWTRVEKLHIGIKMLDIFISSIGIIEISTNSAGSKALKYIKPLPSTLEWIEKKTEATALIRPIYEPMVVQPRDWTGPYDGGYLSSAVKPLKMVKTNNKAYLEELSGMDMPIVYESINAIQRTAWQINSQVLKVMQTFWDSGRGIAGLPPKDGMPLPVKPHDIDTNRESLLAWRKETFKTHTDNLSLLGSRIGVSMTLDTASRYEKYRRIYFPHQLDFRGRVYAVTHLNPQGADYSKGLLRFANGKPLGSEGWKWLAIQGANVAGFDKATLEDRVGWVLENEDEILRIANDPYDNRGWCGTISGVSVDKPWQFLAFCFEWAGYVENGDSFVSKIPVALDGSCSGIQHFSAMLRDDRGGAAVNLIPQELPADVYRLVAERVLHTARIDSEQGTEPSLKHNARGEAYVSPGTKTIAQQWIKFGINRKVTKRSVMTLAYGSRQYGFREQLMEDILWPAHKAATAPDGTVDASMYPFADDGYAAALYMAKLIWEAVNEVLVKAGEAMSWLQGAASLASSEGLPVRWTTPVGFPVMQAYPKLSPRIVKTAMHGSLLYLTMYKQEDSLDKRRQTQGISPNFIHSCDAAHLMLTVARAKQEGISSFAMIHDSFGTTAGETEKFYHTVRNAFIEMYSEMDVLQEFRDELAAQMTEETREKLEELPAKGTLDITLVAQSRFCFA